MTLPETICVNHAVITDRETCRPKYNPPGHGSVAYNGSRRFAVKKSEHQTDKKA